MKIKVPTKKKREKQLKYDPILYGQDMEEGIVAVEPVPDEAMVRVFKREKGRLTTRLDRSKAFFYTNKDEPALDDIWDDGTEIWALDGGLHFDTLVETNSIRTAWWFKKQAQKGNFYMVRERGQYLLSTGKTLFKGMGFDDVVRMYFDIETLTTKGYKFTNPQRVEDKIAIISIKTNRGHKICLALDEDEKLNMMDKLAIDQQLGDTELVWCESEEMLLEVFFSLIEQIDPDVFVNHNIFNFDLWFIHERCRFLDVRMEMGRNRTTPNTYQTSVYIAEKSREILNFEFYGRHVIDTEILARQDDNVKRKYENYQLKYLIKELGEQREGRIIVPGNRISAAWRNEDPEYDRKDLLSYAMDDAEDAQTLDHYFGRAVFKSTQFTPYPYQDVFRLASGGKSETLFVRYYYENNHSLPQRDKKKKFPGGYADVLQYGLINDDIVLGDVKSLYPSLGIKENIQPKDDKLGFYQKIIRLFREYRYEIKDQIKDADEQVKRELKSTDGAIKIYLNTIAYGYITSPFSLFNDYDEGSRITIKGQEILKEVIKYVEQGNGTPVKCDTDGLHFIPPPLFKNDREMESEFISNLSDAMPENIEIGVDGQYQSMLTVDAKSYATKDHQGNYKIKGDTLKSRIKEHFILEHIDTVVRGLLDGNLDVLEESYQYWTDRIKNKEMTQQEIVQYSEIKEPLETYRTKVELGSGNGGRNPDAAYEIACDLAEKNVDIKVGDRIEYYVAESPMTLVIDGRTGKPRRKEKYSRICDLAKNIDEFDPNDINVDHYLQRLADSSEPIYMLFYSYEVLREEFGMKMYKKRREKLEEIGDNIYNDLLR